MARRALTAVASWLIVLGFASRADGEVIGVYDAAKLVAERPRLEARVRELWGAVSDGLLTPDERAALKDARLAFPTVSADGSPLNFYADARSRVVSLPIHSLLLLEEACTAYEWLFYHGYSSITINEYASVLKYRRSEDRLGGELSPPLDVLGIPADALSDERVNEKSLRCRNSAFAYVLAHEMGHVLYRHPGNHAVRAEVSRENERQADSFALSVLRRDRQVPLGAILFFQMTAFTATPWRVDHPSPEAWQEALEAATHPVTSDRVRALAEGLEREAEHYGVNGEVAVSVAEMLKVIAAEMDDPDWYAYFRGIGQGASVAALRPRREQ